MYINFKAINNVLDAKMVLKTHLLIEIFRLLYRIFRILLTLQNISLTRTLSVSSCPSAPKRTSAVFK